MSAGPLFAPSPWDPSDEDPFLWQDRLTLTLTLTLTLALALALALTLTLAL